MRFTCNTVGRSTVTTIWEVEVEVSDLTGQSLPEAINAQLEAGLANELRSEAEAYDEHELDTDSIEAA